MPDDLLKHPLAKAFPSEVLRYPARFFRSDLPNTGQKLRRERPRVDHIQPSILVFPSSDASILPTQILLGNMRFNNIVDKGGFGCVKVGLLKWPNAEYTIVVVKVVSGNPLRKGSFAALHTEAETARDCRVGITDVMALQNQKGITKYYYAMYYVGPSLYSILRANLIDHATRLRLIGSLFVALYELHAGYTSRSGIPRAHGDLKLLNVCMDQSKLVLIDFGASRTDLMTVEGACMLGTIDYCPLNTELLRAFYASYPTQQIRDYMRRANTQAVELGMTAVWVDILAAMRIVSHPCEVISLMTFHIANVLPDYLKSVLNTDNVAAWFSKHKTYTLAAITALWIHYIKGHPIEPSALEDYSRQHMSHQRSIAIYPIYECIQHYIQNTREENEKRALEGCYIVMESYLEQFDKPLPQLRERIKDLLTLLDRKNTDLFSGLYTMFSQYVEYRYPFMSYLLHGLRKGSGAGDIPRIVFYVLGLKKTNMRFAEALRLLDALMADIEVYLTQQTGFYRQTYIDACKDLKSKLLESIGSLLLEDRAQFFENSAIRSTLEDAKNLVLPVTVQHLVNQLLDAGAPLVMEVRRTPPPFMW